jgi:hypothetical protein
VIYDTLLAQSLQTYVTESLGGSKKSGASRAGFAAAQAFRSAALSH